MKHKLYAVFAKESVTKMKGNRGKLTAQAGHAYLHSVWNSDANYPEYANAYKNSDHAYKISLVVDTVEELIALQNHFKDICGTSLVKDAGFTVFEEPTITVLGIGPIPENLIDDTLRNIKLFL